MTCSECNSDSYARGFCVKHYCRWRKHGDPHRVDVRSNHPRVLCACTIDECERQQYARGWCQMHYKRWWTHGDPLVSLSDQVCGPLGRFNKKVEHNGPVSTHRPDLGPCWLWLGATSEDGYGRFNYPNGQLAHRFSYATFVGPIADGCAVDHLCRVRLCVCPTHLESVTRRENTIRGHAAREVRTALYRAFDCDERLLYVGVTCFPGRRFRTHAIHKAWWPQVDRTSIDWYSHRVDAFAAERIAITTEEPLHNVMHRAAA